MVDYIYIIFLIDKDTKKVKETRYIKDPEGLIKLITSIDFEKRNLNFITYKQIDSIEILKDTLKYL